MSKHTDEKDSDPAGPGAIGVVVNDHGALAGTPTGFTYLGILCGMALIAVVLVQYILPERIGLFRMDVRTGQMILCVGLALILAALGTRADAKFRTFAVTGAGAVALIFFYVLDHPDKVDKSRQLVKMVINGNFHETTNLLKLSIDSKTLAGNWQKSKQKHIFVFSEAELLKGACFIFEVNADKNNNNAQGVLEEDSIEIPVKLVREAIKNTDAGQFFYDFSKPGKLWKTKTQFTEGKPPVASRLDCPEQISQQKQRWLPGLSFISSVFAAELLPSDLVKQLESRDPFERREARQSLADAGQSALPILVDTLRRSPESYRIQIGVTDALMKMLSAGKTDKNIIKDALSDDLFSQLVKQVDFPDITLQELTAKFLRQLQDPRTAIELMPILQQPSSRAGGLYSANLLAATFSVAPIDQQQTIKSQLIDLQPSLNEATAAAISEIVISAGTLAGNPSAWAYLGYYLGEDGWAKNQHYFSGNRWPKKGDVLTATASVNIRTGPIEYSDEFGWVNRPSLGAIVSGEEIRVLDVLDIAEGNIWVRFSYTAATGDFHMIVASYKDVEDAIAKARALRDDGYPSEVYLSQNGFHAVTIGKAPQDEVTDLLQDARDKGVAPRDAYLHDGSRFDSQPVFP